MNRRPAIAAVVAERIEGRLREFLVEQVTQERVRAVLEATVAACARPRRRGLVRRFLRGLSLGRVARPC